MALNFANATVWIFKHLFLPIFQDADTYYSAFETSDSEDSVYETADSHDSEYDTAESNDSVYERAEEETLDELQDSHQYAHWAYFWDVVDYNFAPSCFEHDRVPSNEISPRVNDSSMPYELTKEQISKTKIP